MSCTNAREEFLEHTYTAGEVLCAQLKNEDYLFVEDDDISRWSLPKGYTQAQYAEFLEMINFEYDSGYGGQELYGTIWYKDGTWSSRGEYDGSEWWEHHVVPEIPEELKQTLEMK